MRRTAIRTVIIGLAILLTAPPFASGQTRNLPIAPTPKQECYSADCLSLSSTVHVSDACFRTCAAHCAGRFDICLGGNGLNDCRALADRCDLTCQTQCRSYGGPLVGFTD